MRFALIETDSRIVQNVIEWDGESEYDPSPFHAVRLPARSRIQVGDVLGADLAVVDHISAVNDASREATLRQQAHDAITALRTSIDTLKAITDKTNANIGPADTKAVARETRRVARQVLAVSRLLLGAVDSADTGTA